LLLHHFSSLALTSSPPPPIIQGIEENLKIITSSFQSIMAKIRNKRIPKNVY
jgi:hypothetical protein